jgi:hypothetical protein
VRRRDIESLLVRDEDAWTRLSEAAFAGDWDNPQDAAYDKWRDVYGIR